MQNVNLPKADFSYIIELVNRSGGIVMPIITLPGQNRNISVPAGTKLLDALRENSIYLDAPCGGNGTCGKCKVLVDGVEMLACQTLVDRDMTVVLPQVNDLHIVQGNLYKKSDISRFQHGYLLAYDIGTTSVVCALLDEKNGETLAKSNMLNPQVAYGADVITRIQASAQGKLDTLTQLICHAMLDLLQTVCETASILPQQISRVSVVGNPAMQQLLLGIDPKNLSGVPFAPVLTKAETIPCESVLPACTKADLLIVPDIAGFVGADTVGCLLATTLYEKEEPTLLVDIGTNGEMVLGNKDRMIACATAAGPALEGANISCGMRASVGAIDHVWIENGKIAYSVIGGTAAQGICGSGLVDAVATGLELGWINKRGKILTKDHILKLTDTVCLTQEDIRQVQLAKGAIQAGISLLAVEMGVEIDAIQSVQLAGAFGSFVNPESACRIGLLPEPLLGRIEGVGNAALAGAKMLALDPTLLPLSQELTEKVEFMELASLPSFPKTFAKAMLFRESSTIRWLEEAKKLGFDVAVALDPQRLIAREDVRAMCAENRCGAYDKNWTCPPAIGTVEVCQHKMRRYTKGILLQTVGHMQKDVDSRCYRESEKRHIENFRTLTKEIRQEFPQALCLGAGGCRVCKQCAYPAPCRFPDQAISSMEGYGLFVTQVCRDAGVAYHHGEKTITYTACILIE